MVPFGFSNAHRQGKDYAGDDRPAFRQGYHNQANQRQNMTMTEERNRRQEAERRRRLFLSILGYVLAESARVIEKTEQSNFFGQRF